MNSLRFVIVIILLLADFLASALRAALLNTRQSKVDALAEQSERDLSATRTLVGRRSRIRATFKLTQAFLRVSIIGILISIWAPFPEEQISLLVLIAILLAMAFLFWLGEFVFESYVLRSPEEWAIRFTGLGRFMTMIFAPLVSLPLRIAKTAEITRNLVTITEEELISLVDASQQAGEIEAEAQEMIHNVFQLDDTLAREIMVPRVDMLSIDASTPLYEAAEQVVQSGFSRVPIYVESQDNIIGLLYTKDMIAEFRDGDHGKTLTDLVREAYFVPETKKVLELLSEMQSERKHMAVVVDEYGGVAGLVTLEDIVEEIFGEIQDEYDDDEEQLFEQITADEFLFSSRILLQEVNELMQSELENEETDTLGGLIYNLTGHVPQIGESVVVGGLQLTVEQITDNRIKQIRATRNPASNIEE